MIGFVTACIAYAVIGLEMVFFDFKEGYCERDWKLAKRFCCRSTRDLLGGGGDQFGGFMLQGWSSVKKGGEENCRDWKTWGKVWEEWNGKKGGSGDWFEYVAYVLLAVSPHSLSYLPPLDLETAKAST